MVHVIADVGGTNIRLAAVSGPMEVAAKRLMAGDFRDSRSYKWKQIKNVDTAIRSFQEELNLPEKLSGLTLAIAGPVLEHMNEFKLTNWGEPFSRQQLTKHSRNVKIINDFAAQAAIIPLLTEQDLDVLKPGLVQPGARAVLGPGTGLGVAGLAADGQVLSGEGGNVTAPYFPGVPWSVLEAPVPSGRLRAEDVFSGQGLENIYFAKTGSKLAAENISAAAHNGDESALSAMSVFFDFAAVLCSDQALQYGAAGGVYLVGAIMLKNRKLINQKRFAQQFCNIRTHETFLADIPVYQVTKATSGLAGVAAYVSAC